MMTVHATYGDLFELLSGLGFTEASSPPSTVGARVFVHLGTNTVLAFRRNAKDPVTPADLLSTEVHLSGRALIDKPITRLLTDNQVR